MTFSKVMLQLRNTIPVSSTMTTVLTVCQRMESMLPVGFAPVSVSCDGIGNAMNWIIRTGV